MPNDAALRIRVLAAIDMLHRALAAFEHANANGGWERDDLNRIDDAAREYTLALAEEKANEPKDNPPSVG